MYIRNGFSENLAELSRALHFGHKSGDGSYLSLLDDEGTFMDQNFILGQEFESFSQKGPVIESGVNTLNSLMTLRLTFNQGCFTVVLLTRQSLLMHLQLLHFLFLQ